MALGRTPVAAQRDIHIVTEPAGQRHVPAPPELGHRAADVRIVEVFEKLEAKHLAKANRHIGVTGKVVVNLQRIGRRTKPRQQKRQLIGWTEPNPIRDLCEHVGQQHLFGQPVNKPVDALGKARHRMCALRDLVVHITVAHNRPGNQLWEHRNVQRERKRVFLRPRLTAVHVNHIAERLKGVKRDADRHDDIQQRRGRAEHAVRRRNEKVEVLVHTSIATLQKTHRASQIFRYGLRMSRPKK